MNIILHSKKHDGDDFANDNGDAGCYKGASHTEEQTSEGAISIHGKKVDNTRIGCLAVGNILLPLMI